MSSVTPKRITIVSWGMFIAILFCLVGVLRLAIGKAGKYNGDDNLYKTYSLEEYDSLDQSEKLNCIVEKNISPPRGVIYDDCDRPLVSNVQVYPLGIDGKNFDFSEKYFKKGDAHLDTLIQDLAVSFYNLFHERYPQKKLDFYKEKFATAFKEKKRVQLFNEEQVQKEKQMILDKDLNIIAQLPVFCGTIQPEDRARYGLDEKAKINFSYILDKGSRKIFVRVHPYGELSKRILGSAVSRNGIDGSEKFSPILAGKAGLRKTLFVNGISIPLESEESPMDGGHIHTTLNIDIQKIVHNELLKKTEKLRPNWSCAIVMETATGDIKAISNFAPQTTVGDSVYVEVRNNAMVAEAAEPGSTFKLASLLAFLEQTNCDTSRRYSINVHTFDVKGRQYRKQDNEKAAAKGEQTGISPKEIIQRSSNVGVSMMIRDAFPNDYQGYIRKLDSLYITLGFSAQIGKLPPLNLKYNTKNFHEQYASYFGAGFYMQPMQTLVYYNAVANNGKMMQPRFVSYAQIGNTKIEYPPVVIREQIASPKAIRIAKEYLRAVVAEYPGTARRFNDENLPFAGKTGTRDIYDRSAGKYDKNRNSISFCGYFPADNPQYTCIVYMYNVVGGSDQAVEVFANIAKKIMATSKSIDKTQKNIPVYKPLRKVDYEKIARNWGVKISQVSGKYVVASSDHQSVEPYEIKVENKIPYVVGLSAADAIYELKKAGFKVSVSGFGLVVKQEYFAKQNMVVLTLRSG